MKFIEKGSCIFYPIIDLKPGFDRVHGFDRDTTARRDIVRWINKNVN